MSENNQLTLKKRQTNDDHETNSTSVTFRSSVANFTPISERKRS